MLSLISQWGESPIRQVEGAEDWEHEHNHKIYEASGTLLLKGSTQNQL